MGTFVLCRNSIGSLVTLLWLHVLAPLRLEAARQAARMPES
ncbi:hypothetical protein NRY68_17815 [Acidithiobacillus ferrooxidans]|nr:hypothetical protein [Acidithiobacillus ferrooxidans]MCR1347612.1 hypothetical protein [Acidithiobacillus ferrooxidans]MCR1355390.1 hypothetical protein [Acidithiobacillus ferrooxidans]